MIASRLCPTHRVAASALKRRGSMWVFRGDPHREVLKYGHRYHSYSRRNMQRAPGVGLEHPATGSHLRVATRLEFARDCGTARLIEKPNPALSKCLRSRETVQPIWHKRA